MKFIRYTILLGLFFGVLRAFSQDALPVFQDYLSDNVYLVHPSAAGIGETGKIRVAIRLEGLGAANAPQLQTASIHGKFGGDSKAAFGLVVINNTSNRNFRQQGIQGTYAYHLDLDRTNNFEQLSFGLSISTIFREISGGSVFTDFDPRVPQVPQVLFSLNIDVSAAYHWKGLATYLTVKNVNLSNEDEFLFGSNELNLKNYVFGTSYFFGNKEKVRYEPSTLLQYKDQTGEKVLDVNLKVYKEFLKAQVWAGFSYRSSFGSTDFRDSEFISPIIGVNFNKMIFSYTYSRQLNEVVFGRADFHQISLGLNVLFRELKLPANPNINSVLF